MKKLIALLLVLTIAFALFGCTDKNNEGANNNGGNNNGGGNDIGNTIGGGNNNSGIGGGDGVIEGPIVDIP